MWLGGGGLGRPVMLPRVWLPVAGLAAIGCSGGVRAVGVVVAAQCSGWGSGLGRRELGTRFDAVRLTRPVEY
jgi:hypothetical protein